MMSTPLFKKLNFKQQKEIYILNHPAEFKIELDAIKTYTTVQTDRQNASQIEFALIFVKKQKQIDSIAPHLDQKLKDDATVWFAYPKKTSKKYQSEVNRDHGWKLLGYLGFEAVRQVAIDSNWSALQFRKVEYIKVMKRNRDFAMTEKGKQKIKKNKNPKLA
ncbi:MAG: hypothetical protein VW080_04705 [Flavobacteriaceae bacterium]